MTTFDSTKASLNNVSGREVGQRESLTPMSLIATLVVPGEVGAG
jgi:hypothetical protein